MRDQLDQLAAEVSAAGLSRPQLEAVIYQLSAQERRLFLLLAAGAADTVAVRNRCSIGNPSEVANNLNRKLAAAGDGRRVVCKVEEHRNQFGEEGRLGIWRLVGVEHERAAA